MIRFQQPSARPQWVGLALPTRRERRSDLSGGSVCTPAPVNEILIFTPMRRRAGNEGLALAVGNASHHM